MLTISKKAVEQILIDTPELPGYAFKIIDEKIQELPVIVIRDCTACFGASFGDCDTCERIVTQK